MKSIKILLIILSLGLISHAVAQGFSGRYIGIDENPKRSFKLSLEDDIYVGHIGYTYELFTFKATLEESTLVGVIDDGLVLKGLS